MVVKKLVTLSPAYIEKIAAIKERLGVPTDSEVIRRAIDAYAEELGIDFEKIKEG